AIEQLVVPEEKRLLPLQQHLGLPGGDKLPLHELFSKLGRCERNAYWSSALGRQHSRWRGHLQRRPARTTSRHCARQLPLLRREQIAFTQVLQEFFHRLYSSGNRSRLFARAALRILKCASPGGALGRKDEPMTRRRIVSFVAAVLAAASP